MTEPNDKASNFSDITDSVDDSSASEVNIPDAGVSVTSETTPTTKGAKSAPQSIIDGLKHLQKKVQDGTKMVIITNKDGSFTSKDKVMGLLLSFQYSQLKLMILIEKTRSILATHDGLSNKQVTSLINQLEILLKPRNKTDQEKMQAIIIVLKKHTKQGLSRKQTTIILIKLDAIHNYTHVLEYEKLKSILNSTIDKLLAMPFEKRRTKVHTVKFCQILNDIIIMGEGRLAQTK